jgi:hypothetical protein
VFLIALAGLVLNDHLLKGAGLLPAVITGKLSDVCGLVVAPAALAWLLGARGRGARALCLAAVGAFLAAIKLWAPAARFVEMAAGHAGLPWRIWQDASDLLALPALAIAWWLTGGAAPARLRRLVLAGAGTLACAATSAIPMHSAQAYVVNRTRAPLRVEVAFLGGRNFTCGMEAGGLLRTPEGWFRDGDFSDSELYQLEPAGVLPLRFSGCALRVAVGTDHRLVVASEPLPFRRLENHITSDDLDDDRGLLFVEGNAASPVFRAGRGLALRFVSPDWASLPASACAEAAVQRLEVGPLPETRGARIVARRDLGGGCFAVVLEGSFAGGGAGAGAPLPSQDAGGSTFEPPPPRDGGAGLSDASAPGGGPSDAAPGVPSPGDDHRLLSFCMPEALFPFQLGDRIDIRQTSLGVALERGSTALRFPNPSASQVGTASGCGFVREPCGAIWVPRQILVGGVALAPGVPLTMGSSTFYLARAMQVVTPGRCDFSPNQIRVEMLEVIRGAN